MKSYSVPEGVKIPDFDDYLVDGRYSMTKDDEVTGKFLTDLAETLRGMGYTGNLTGKVVYFPVADGAAQYMVAQGRKTILIHLPLHDAWHIPAAHMRGLRVADIKRLATAPSLFGR
jgi:hypothetical protein